MKSKKAVVLLSGGLDSATVLYYAKAEGFKCSCLIFDYDQRHKKEILSAKKIAKLSGCKYKLVKITLPWGGSSLLDKNTKIKSGNKSAVSSALPATYVPGRNTVFISFALSYAETIGAGTIFIGANAVDFSGYPDCRPHYYEAWNKLLKTLGTGVKIVVPLVNLSKEGIIRLGLRLKVPYKNTWSCYLGGKMPCGICDSCRFRAIGFAKAGRKDPAA